MMRRAVAIAGLLIATLALHVSPATAAEQADPGGEAELTAEAGIPTAPVEIDGKLLFRVRGVTSFPAEQRARGISHRIEEVAANPAFKVDAVRIVESPQFTSLMAGNTRIMVVAPSYLRSAILPTGETYCPVNPP